MNVSEALKIMGLSLNTNHEMIKKTRRALASKYHPDKNPDGLKMMQDVNRAYDRLISLPASYFDVSESGKKEQEEEQEEQEEQEEFSMFRKWGLFVKYDNLKTWVSGKTYDYKENLKSYGFRWSPDDKAWWRYNN